MSAARHCATGWRRSGCLHATRCGAVRDACARASSAEVAGFRQPCSGASALRIADEDLSGCPAPQAGPSALPPAVPAAARRVALRSAATFF
eukprot:3554198-Prymnesium_polylepis.2